MPLCPVCFNAPAYCECATPFEPTADELGQPRPYSTAVAEREAEERLLREVDPKRRALLSEIIAGFIASR